MKIKIYVILFSLLACLSIANAELYFPPITGDEWESADTENFIVRPDLIPELYQFLEANNTKAFIVLKDGKIALEKYFGSFGRDSAWYWASAGKCLTSLLVGIAEQNGALSIDDKITKYLGAGRTSCPADKEDLITVRNLITMTSGLDDGVDDNHCTDRECLVYKADAGARWAYHNAPYTLLDEVLQAATGKNANQYQMEHVRPKTGITGLFVKIDYDNVFISKVRSFARFGLLILNKGVWNGVKVLDNPEYATKMAETSQDLNKSYGYLWWLNGKESVMVPGLQTVFKIPLCRPAPADMISALGKNGQIIDIVPSMNIVLVRAGDAPDGGEVPFTLNDSIWSRFSKIIERPGDVGENGALSTTFIAEAGIVKIESQESDFEAEIYNLSGQSVFRAETNTGAIEADLSHLPAGAYFLKARGSRESVFAKVIIAP